MCVWVVGLHVAYLLHVGFCEWYDDNSKILLSCFRIRYDFTTVHPVLLEWIHTGETAAVLALAAFGCRRNDAVVLPCALVALFSLIAAANVACVANHSPVFGRRSRHATGCAAALALVPPLLPRVIAPYALLAVHAHAAAAPSAAVFRSLARRDARRSGLFLLLAHGCAVGLGAASLYGRRSAALYAAGGAGAAVVFCRELALAVDRRWPRTRFANGAYASSDLAPPTPLEALLPRRAFADGGGLPLVGGA